MPHRTINLVLAAVGIAGLVVIGALAIWGADIRLAARRGPMWKRKLVAAGLLLLAMMGVGSCGETSTEESADRNAAASAAARRKSTIAQAWRDLDSVWRDGADYAFGRHGPWPFDKAAKDAALKQTEQFDTHVAILERLGELKNIEADALRLEWDFIQEQIELTPAADLREGQPEYETFRRKAVKRARVLLSHLNALCESEAPNQQVARVLLKRASLLYSYLLGEPERISHRLYQEAQASAESLREPYRKLKSGARRQGSGLDKHAAWKAVSKILAPAVGLRDADASEGELLGVEDPGRQKRLIAQARKGINSLLAQKAIGNAEAKALRWMLLAVAENESDSGPGILSLDFDYRSHETIKSEKWVALLGQLAGQKSMLRPVSMILLPLVEAKADPGADDWRTMAICPTYPYRPRVKLSYSSDAWKEIRRSFADIRELPLKDSHELLESDDWKKIVRAHLEGPEITGRMLFDSRLAVRRVGELFGPLDKSISSLARRGLLTEIEAKILLDHRQYIRETLQYELEDFPSSVVACNRILRRTELLKKLAMLDRLDWRVADYILPAVESDLAILDELPRASGFYVNQPRDRTRVKMLAVRGVSEEVLKKIRAKQAVRGKTLAQTNEWRALARAWREAQANASLELDQIVSSRFGAQRLVGRLKDAAWDIEGLRRAGLLSDTEAELLNADMRGFIELIALHPTWDEPPSTCYDAGFPPIDKDRWTALQKRMGLLEKLVDSPRLRPEVVAKLLYVLENDIALPAEWRLNGVATKAQKDQAVQTQKAAAELVAKMRKRLQVQDAELAENVKWRGIVKACSLSVQAMKIRMTFRERRDIQGRLDQAALDAYLLYAQGVLTAKEMLVIGVEIDNSRNRLGCSRPTDFASGVYVPLACHGFRLHREEEMRRPAYDNMLSGELPDREVLKLVAESMDADIGILTSGLFSVYCDRFSIDEFPEQAGAMKAMLAKIRDKLSEGR